MSNLKNMSKWMSLALALTASLLIVSQQALLISVFPMWNQGAVTVPVSWRFTPLRGPPYAGCFGFYGCQRAMCDAAMTQNATFVAVLIENMSAKLCPALDNLWESLHYLPVMLSLVICDIGIIISPLLAWYTERGLSFPIVITVSYACWYYYLSMIVRNFGETAPWFVVWFSTLVTLSMVGLVWTNFISGM